MADVVFAAAIVAFFALSALYVIWCDGIVGPDVLAAEPAEEAMPEPTRVAA